MVNSATFRGRLLYDGFTDDQYLYSDTPDSEKDSHSLKVRYDMSNDTVISAGYISAEVKSNKMDDVGLELSQNSLETDYDSYSIRASTRVGAWRVTGGWAGGVGLMRRRTRKRSCSSSPSLAGPPRARRARARRR